MDRWDSECFKYEWALVHTDAWDAFRIALNLGYEGSYPMNLFVRAKNNVEEAQWHQMTYRNAKRFEIEGNPYQLYMGHDLFRAKPHPSTHNTSHTCMFRHIGKDVDLNTWFYMSNEQIRDDNGVRVHWPAIVIYVRKAGSMVFQVECAQFPATSCDRHNWHTPSIPCSVRFVTIGGNYCFTIEAPVATEGWGVKQVVRQFVGKSSAWTIHVIAPNGDIIDDEDTLGVKLFGEMAYMFMVPKALVDTPAEAIAIFDFNPFFVNVHM